MCIRCCRSCPDCQECNLANRYWIWTGYCLVLLGGVAALVLGIFQIASAEQTTASKYFQTLNDNFMDVEVPDMGRTTITMTAPYSGIAFTKATTQIPLVFYKGNKETYSAVFNDTFYTASMPLPSDGTSKLFRSRILVILATDIAGTPQTFSAQIESSAFPLKNKLGYYLNTVCFVISRTKRNGKWTLSDSHDTCYYPFGTEDNLYTATPPTTLTVIVRSQYDPYLFLQKQSEHGPLDPGVPWRLLDKDVRLVSASTVNLLYYGVGIMAAGFAACCLFTIWCTRLRRYHLRHPELAGTPGVPHYSAHEAQQKMNSMQMMGGV